MSSCCRNPSTGHVDVLLGMESLLPAGAKKVPKIYQIACHPLQPHLVVAGAQRRCADMEQSAFVAGRPSGVSCRLMLLYTIWPGIMYALVGALRQQSLLECKCHVREPPLSPVGMHGACCPAVCPPLPFRQLSAWHYISCGLMKRKRVSASLLTKVLPVVLLCWRHRPRCLCSQHCFVTCCCRVCPAVL